MIKQKWLVIPIWQKEVVGYSKYRYWFIRNNQNLS